MAKTTYSFDFNEKIPDKEIQKIILITKSGFSFNGKLSSENNNDFSVMNLLILSSIFIYIPIITHFNLFIENFENIFKFSLKHIMSFFPIYENTMRETVLTYIFISITINFIILFTLFLYLCAIYYHHMKYICRYIKSNYNFSNHLCIYPDH